MYMMGVLSKIYYWFKWKLEKNEIEMSLAEIEAEMLRIDREKIRVNPKEIEQAQQIDVLEGFVVELVDYSRFLEECVHDMGGEIEGRTLRKYEPFEKADKEKLN